MSKIRKTIANRLKTSNVKSCCKTVIVTGSAGSEAASGFARHPQTREAAEASVSA